MIGKLIKNPRADGKHKARVAGLLNYITAPEKESGTEKCVYSASSGFLSDTLDGQIAEMSGLAYSAKRKSNDPVMHVVLSWHEGEFPTQEQVDDAARIFLESTGLVGHQCVYALHSDTDNVHMHIAVNRTNPETERVVKVNKGFTIEAVHQAVARIEHEQGWQREPNGRYQVLESGELSREQRTAAQRQPEQKKRDMENRSGEKSAERIAIETAAPIIKQAQTWEQLHRELAKQGMRYEKKGSGALLYVNDVSVKASSVAQHAGLNKLQKRLGVYEPPREPLPVAHRAPEPLRPEAGEYVVKRRAYYAEKSAAKVDLDRRHERERKQLAEKQKQQRKELLSGSWKGKGAALSLGRSVLAAEHAAQKLDIKDRHKIERQQLQKQYRPYPDLEQWMRMQRGEEQAVQWRYRASEPQRTEGPTAEPPTPRDIRAYVPEIVGQQVHYALKNRATAFVDKGKSIDIHDWRNEGTTLAALQLSAQKWGSFNVTGNDEYKAMCAKLAAEHGFKITNPELQERIQQERQRLQQRKEKVMTPQHQEFAKVHEALRCDSYKVQINNPSPAEGEPKGFTVGRGRGYQEVVSKSGNPVPLIPADSVIDEIMRERRVKDGWSPMFKPVSEKYSYILVDDIDAGRVAQMKADGYRPAFVQATSTGSLQAVLVIPKVDDTRVANAVSVQIKNMLSGDKACNGVDHTMRIAGFENRKPKHRREDGTYPTVTVTESNFCVCEKTAQLAEELKPVAVEKVRKQREAVASVRVEHSNSTELAGVWSRFAEKHVSRALPSAWKSEHDWRMACMLRKAGYSKGEVAGALMDLSPRIDRGTSDASWSDKHIKTAENAFGGRGDEYLRITEKYHAAWEKDLATARHLYAVEQKRKETAEKKAALDAVAEEWNGKALSGVVQFIDNTSMYIKHSDTILRVEHNTQYEDRPRVGGIAVIKKGEDGKTVMKPFAPVPTRGRDRGIEHGL